MEIDILSLLNPEIMDGSDSYNLLCVCCMPGTISNNDPTL